MQASAKPRAFWPLFTTALTLLLAEAAMANPPEADQATDQTNNRLPEVRTTLADQTAVAVTIYNSDLALIKDQRQISLPAGRLDLAFRDVSARIKPQTALLRVPEGDQTPAPRVIEQNFDFDLLTPGKLLEKYVGREVGLIRTHPTTGEETEETATVLAANDGVVLKLGDRIETGSPGSLGYRIVYRDIPANLRDRPTLVMRLDNQATQPQALELSYLTGGLSWQADYVGELSSDETKLDLTGWVTLENRSGTSYSNARLQLVAGDVNRAPDPPSMFDGMAERRMMAAAAPPMEEEALFEYHLYSLAEPTTIADNQSKQVSLLAASGAKVRKELVIQGGAGSYQRALGDLAQDLDVQVFLELTNDEASNLGMPLPAGTLRVYKRDSAGNAQFIGEDRIDHTPKNETFKVLLGQSFDVTASRKQTEFTKRSGSGPWQYEFDSAFEILVKNAKSEPATVTLQESLPGDWKILEESAPHQKGNAHTAVWTLDVPAEGSTTLTYRVRVRL
ncbi:DUF4139 domain-containing protein [Thiorhodovibrio frisius]|uniref:DUF4139 domain-containing protein n=1 Tax=Thiorhodovibrio frisius TaxID=631362 RepID=H8Z3U9_9GAMM|nr:DUF4139 domain-containing protein [Thiorhodovibrio frisius]EIC21101.1 hypothetical protein Thi970DRAFT_04788 [Thiorhodovibrio frisius]